MSRIDSRAEPLISTKALAGGKSIERAKQADGTPVVHGLKGLKSKIAENLGVRSKKVKRLTGVTEIVESDLEPLTGKKRDDLVGELHRIMGKIEEIEEALGADDTTVLCKVMIREQVRRLMLVEDGQADASGLKGVA